MHRLIQRTLVVLSFILCTPAYAALGCLSSDPLPTAPAAGTESTSFAASNSATDTFDVLVWRQSCAPGASRLFVRLTPTAGSPFICTDFHILQGINQYSTALLPTAAPGAPFCNVLAAPATFVLAQDTADPSFNVDAALTLIYSFDAGRLALADLPALGAGAPPIAPVVGLWWNPAESGSGYALDVKHQTLVVTVYSYSSTGAPLWYIVVGPIVNNTFSGSLEKFQNGQCISCVYRAPTGNGTDGQMTITFTSPSTATMTLPGGRSFGIVPQVW